MKKLTYNCNTHHSPRFKLTHTWSISTSPCWKALLQRLLHLHELDTSSQNNYYLEVGKDSGEAGYKFKKGNFTLKGKLESTKNFQKNGLETEVRYTFK